MIILALKLNHIYGFNDFSINFTYPKKIVNSIIEDEYLEGHPRFRYKKAVILMGANATGKTSLGRAILNIFSYMESGNDDDLLTMAQKGRIAEITMDFVNQGDELHRIAFKINPSCDEVRFQYQAAKIGAADSYESCCRKLKDQTEAVQKSARILVDRIGPLSYRFAYPEIAHTLKAEKIDQQELLKTLRAVIGTLDPTLKDISIAKDLKNSFIIRRRGEEIIIQDGKLLNREALSSGTIEGIDVALFLASMKDYPNTFYYCDEHFSYIQSDIEKRIFGIMLERLSGNSQLIFTTHNTDMLDLNLPKHAYTFLRKQKTKADYQVSAVSASDILKRNTDSVRNAVENDVFMTLPDDTLLDTLENEND
jgi:hypothetical protein